MYSLIELSNERFAEYLNLDLRRHRLDSFVFKDGITPDGKDVFSVSCLNSSELNQARYLICRSSDLIRDIHPEAAIIIREMRFQNSDLMLRAVTSKPDLVASSVLLVIVMAVHVLGL